MTERDRQAFKLFTIDFIKMDVQSSESGVIKGMKNLLKKTKLKKVPIESTNLLCVRAK